MEPNIFELRPEPAARHGLTWDNPPRSQEDEGKVQRGREALGRQKSGWDDWMDLAEPLAIGRTEAMANANTNQPSGKRYQKEIKNWLCANGFEEIDKTMRSRVLECLDHRKEIETWRATLTESKRLRYNHPNTVLRKWKESRPGRTAPQRESPWARLQESVRQLAEENFALRRDMERGALELKDKILNAAEKALDRRDTTKTSQADDPQFTEPPSDEPDVALFLPANMPSDAHRRLIADIDRIRKRYGLRCVWNAPINASEEDDND